MKVCSVCGEAKPVEMFGADRRQGENGRRSYCKACDSERSLRRYHGEAWTPPAIQCEGCGERMEGRRRKFCTPRCQDRAWRDAHPEYVAREKKRTAKRDAVRVASGAEARRMIARRASKTGVSPEEFVAEKARVARAKSVQRTYRHHSRLRKIVNRDRMAELAREANRATMRRIMLAKYHADPDNWPTRRKRHRIFERDGWRCRSCGKAVTDRVGAKDSRRAVAGHIVAAATGGGWTDENIATLCHPCNVADGVNRIPIQAHLAW